MIDFLQYLLNPMTLILSISGILTSFFGFLAVISKAEKTPKWIAWGSFLAGLIVIGGGIWSGFQNEKLSSEMKNKSDALLEMSQQNTKLAIKNSELSEEISNSITGGNSFCYLFPSISYEKMNTINFKLNHMGDNPVYDVQLRIWDSTCLSKPPTQLNTGKPAMKSKIITTLDEWNKLRRDPDFIAQQMEESKASIDHMRKCLTYQNEIGTVVPGKSGNVMDPVYLSCTIPSNIDFTKYSQEYSISMIARNGQYRQSIKIDIKNSNFHVYSKVEKRIPNSKWVTVREYESLDSSFIIHFIK